MLFFIFSVSLYLNSYGFYQFREHIIEFWVLEKKGIFVSCINLMKTCNRAVASVRTISGNTSEFMIIIDFHQGPTPSPYLFVLVVDVLTRHIQDDIL